MKTQFILLRSENIRLFLAALIILCGTCAYGQNNKRPKNNNKEKAQKVSMTIPVQNKSVKIEKQQVDIDVIYEDSSEKDLTYESWMTEGFAIKSKSETIVNKIDDDLLLEVEDWMTDAQSWKCD